MSVYKERIAKGLCGSCGKPNKKGSLCSTCKKKSKDRQTATREKLRAEGLCLTCRKPVEPGKSRCTICLAKNVEEMNELRRVRKATGKCQSCGKKKPKTGCTLCQGCIDRMTVISNERYRENRAKGVCGYCGADCGDNAACPTCLERQRTHRQELKVEVLSHYGGLQCSHCPVNDVDVLELDHIAGGGGKHRKEIEVLGGYEFYLWIKRNGFPKGFRVLCSNCNRKAHADSKLKT